MNCSVNRKRLSEALTLASLASSPSNPIRAARNIELATVKEQLSIRSTNLDVEITALVQLTDGLPPSSPCCVDGRALANLANEMPGNETRLVVEGAWLKVEAPGASYKIRLEGERPPEMARSQDGVELHIDPQAFARASRRAIVASGEKAPNNPAEPYVHLFTGKTLTVASTNTHRIALVELPAEGSSEIAALIPKSSAQILQRASASIGNTARLRVSTQEVSLRGGTIRVVCRAADIPPLPMLGMKSKLGDPSCSITVATKHLRSTLARMYGLWPSGTTPWVVLRSHENMLEITLGATDLGDGREEIQAEGSLAHEIGLSLAYILEAAAHCGTERLRITGYGEERPVLINEPEAGDVTWENLIAQRRI